MCGIFGWFSKGALRNSSEKCLREGCLLMAHRGPDDHGEYSDPENKVFLGHRRLSILDVSALGHQPMQSADGSLVVVYNGEIYNYLEIRSELTGKGHTFFSESDTEVLIQSYREWGIECVSRFNGMFAFALWDRQRRKLFLVRDRLGIKPLYYLEDASGTTFASEVKAFRAIPEIGFSPDEGRIPSFLRDGYISGEETFFRGIRKLPPGTYMEISENGTVRKRYWELSFGSDRIIDDEEWAERLDSLLADAVHLRLRSDVPVGVFLSGGLDSTTIVDYLHGKSDIPIKTFSVAYDLGKNFDETPFARIAARKYGTDHHEYFVSPEEFRDFIPKYVWFMDEPVSEAAGVSLYYISRLAREHVTVILSGEGSDELFGGYDMYRYMLWIEAYRRLPLAIRKGIGKFAAQAAPTGSRGRKYLDLASLPLESRYRGVSLLPDSSIEGVCPDFISSGRFDPADQEWRRVYRRSEGWTDLSRMLHADMNSWLINDILLKADKMTMANSLELRVPFLDYRVVEAAAAMPDRLKIWGKGKKRILKRLMRGRVPGEILRRKKMGFPTPIAVMFRSQLNGYVKELLLDHRTLARGYFSRAGIEKAISEHENGTDHSQLLWRLIVLEEWFRVFSDPGTD